MGGGGGVWVVLPEEYRVFENRGIINIKKLWALSQIKDKYEYIIVIDAETRIIKSVDIEQVCKDWFEKKILYGNYAWEYTYGDYSSLFGITENCKRFFGDRASELTAQCNGLYLWGNSPWFYQSSTLDDFFIKTGINGDAVKNLTWYDFDWYIYAYYLMLYRGFQIDNMKCIASYGVCEEADMVSYSDKWKSLQYYWMSLPLYKKMRQQGLGESVFMLFQCDRHQSQNKIRNLNTIERLYLRFIISVCPFKRVRKKIRKILRGE